MTETEVRQLHPRRRRNAKVTDRYQQLIDGVLTVDDLDDEEIVRGMLRNADGSFHGRPPRVIPWVMHAALREAMNKRMERKLLEALPQALDSLIAIANNKYASADARVKAIAQITDRALGKVPDKAEIHTTITAKWEEAMAGGRLVIDLEPEPEMVEEVVVEAEVVEPQITVRPRPKRKQSGVRI